MDIDLRRARAQQAAVAAIEAACYPHDPVVWASGAIDGMRYTLMRCSKCGMMNPPTQDRSK